GELGVMVKDGNLLFHPCLLRKDEFTKKPRNFNYVDIHKNYKTIELDTGSLSFTYCQVPVIYRLANDNKMLIVKVDGTVTEQSSLELDASTSKSLFERKGKIEQIQVEIDSKILK
ncbi:MAG: hypothetical protein KJP21_00235, partial [Bacteroidia bacterium]|nr:hypothetical protein [Bacteroidia bacterium]